MGLDVVEMDGTEKAVRGGRPPLVMEPGKKYSVVLRGMGVFIGGPKKDFKSGEHLDEKIVNAELVVCSPNDYKEEYAVSFTTDSVAGKAILNFGQKDDEGTWWLKQEMLNVVGYLGSKEIKTKEEYDRGYTQLFFNAELKKNGDVKLAKGMPEGASLVGAAQRGVDEDEVEEEGLI